MRRYSYLLSLVVWLVSVGSALAQVAAAVLDTTPAPSTGNYIWKLLLSALTLGGSAVTPYITKWLTMWVLILIGKIKVKVPEPLLIFISTVIAGVFAGVMGTNTDLPLHGDTALLAGASIGGMAQKFANSAPVKPTPEAMAKVVEKEPTAKV